MCEYDSPGIIELSLLSVRKNLIVIGDDRGGGQTVWVARIFDLPVKRILPYV
jgi:hypothetical protein